MRAQAAEGGVGPLPGGLQASVLTRLVLPASKGPRETARWPATPGCPPCRATTAGGQAAVINVTFPAPTSHCCGSPASVPTGAWAAAGRGAESRGSGTGHYAAAASASAAAAASGPAAPRPAGCRAESRLAGCRAPSGQVAAGAATGRRATAAQAEPSRSRGGTALTGTPIRYNGYTRQCDLTKSTESPDTMPTHRCTRLAAAGRPAPLPCHQNQRPGTDSGGGANPARQETSN